MSDEEIRRIEDRMKREEEEERERKIAKEKWLREREDLKRTVQVGFKVIKKILYFGFAA